MNDDHPITRNPVLVYDQGPLQPGPRGTDPYQDIRAELAECVALCRAILARMPGDASSGVAGSEGAVE